MTSKEPDPSRHASGTRSYLAATEDVPPPSREIAVRDAEFWLELLEAAVEHVESGQGTADDQRVIHEGLLIVQRLLDHAEFEDPDRWLRTHPAVAKVVAEALADRESGKPYNEARATAEAEYCRPTVERARRDLEVLKLRLTIG